jgi:hypothetical protein
LRLYPRNLTNCGPNWPPTKLSWRVWACTPPDCGPARAHLRRAHHPASDARLRFNRFAETWAALSIGLMMISLVILVFFGQQYLVWGIVALVSLMVFVEAGFRRQLARLVTSLTIGLAVISALIVIYDFFWSIVILAVLLTGGYIMWENARELWE